VPARVIESALDLARAEATLALLHVRDVAVRSIALLVATIVAVAFAQVALVLAVLIPVLRSLMAPSSVLLAVGAPAAISLLAAGLALKTFRGLRRPHVMGEGALADERAWSNEGTALNEGTAPS